MKFSLHLMSAGLLSLCCAAAGADTLREIYELALDNDAQLKSREAQYRANLETENLGRAALLPQVNATTITARPKPTPMPTPSPPPITTL